MSRALTQSARGALDLYAFGSPQKYGVGAELAMRVRKNLGIFAQGEYGLTGTESWWTAQGGLRLNW